MSYAAILAKKIRMCARFGHLAETRAQTLVADAFERSWYPCDRCGELLPRQPRNEAAS